MILLDEIDESSPLKSSISQSPQLQSQEQQRSPAQQEPQGLQQHRQADLPPPYSRPVTPAPLLERRAGEDVEGNPEPTSEPRRRRKRPVAKIAKMAKHFATWGSVTLLFMMIWRFFLFNSFGWMRHIDDLYKPAQLHEHGRHSFPDDIIPSPSKPILHLPPPIGDDSEIHHEHSTETLQRLCLSNASWVDTTRYSKGKMPYHSSDTSLQLRVDSKLLFIVARTPRASGRLQILQSAVPDEMARVYITARYESGKTIDDLSACLMERHPGELGVGIFTPQHSKSDTSFDIDINLLLPAPVLPDFAYNLQTDLTKFSQDIGADMRFGSVHLRSRGMPVVGKNIRAREATIETSNAPIVASITASRLLSLKTTGHPIHANISLQSIGPFLSALEIENTNSSIDTHVHLDLMESSQLRYHPKYEIQVNASNTELNLDLLSAPKDAALNIVSFTSEKPSLIKLPPSFEGGFTLTAKEGYSAGVESLRAVDMSIAHDLEDGMEIVRGFVGSPNAGRVNVTTTNAANKLVV